MKKAFYMMGIALLAGAMLFTACKKDEEESTETYEESTETYTVTLSYGGETWNTNTVLYAIDEGNLILQAESGNAGFSIVCGTEARNHSFATEDYGVEIWKGNDTIKGNTNGSINITAIDLTNTKTISARLSCEMGDVGTGNVLTIAFDNTKLTEGEK